MLSGGTGGQPVSGLWLRIDAAAAGSQPAPFIDHSAVVTSRGVLVFGGCTGGTGGNTASDELWLLELDAAGGPGASWRHLSPARGPAARCAHAAVAQPRGMVLQGGRYPLPTSAGQDDTWRTLDDVWLLDIDAALVANASDAWQPIRPSSSTAVAEQLLNRSDHAMLLYSGSLFIFGGLYTDVTENKIYVLKDFHRLGLPAALGTNSSDAGACTASAPSSACTYTQEQLEWGPSYRFDTTMILAPAIGIAGRRLIDAPVVYGGGGGTAIFAELWAYDTQDRVWHKATPQPPLPSPSPPSLPPADCGTPQFVECVRRCTPCASGPTDADGNSCVGVTSSC
eukprot:6645672-Prymnesium_polylepis.1